jgi:hypothetical protein
LLLAIMAQHNAQLLEAVAMSCARDGVAFLTMSVHLAPAYIAARSKRQSRKALLDFTLEECSIITTPDDSYNPSDPNPAVLEQMLANPAAASLQALLPGAAAAAAAGTTSFVVRIAITCMLQSLSY